MIYEGEFKNNKFTKQGKISLKCDDITYENFTIDMFILAEAY